jgi:hypothetical protein
MYISAVSDSEPSAPHKLFKSQPSAAPRVSGRVTLSSSKSADTVVLDERERRADDTEAMVDAVVEEAACNEGGVAVETKLISGDARLPSIARSKSLRVSAVEAATDVAVMGGRSAAVKNVPNAHVQPGPIHAVPVGRRLDETTAAHAASPMQMDMYVSGRLDDEFFVRVLLLCDCVYEFEHQDDRRCLISKMHRVYLAVL